MLPKVRRGPCLSLTYSEHLLGQPYLTYFCPIVRQRGYLVSLGPRSTKEDKMVMEVKGSVVVITGSAQGIGRAVAEHLLAEGAKVAIISIIIVIIVILFTKMKFHIL